VRHADLARSPDNYRRAALGAGRAAAPVTLRPGDHFEARFAIRKHYTTWTTPTFEELPAVRSASPFALKQREQQQPPLPDDIDAVREMQELELELGTDALDTDPIE
jgi:hypothetical protein